VLADAIIDPDQFDPEGSGATSEGTDEALRLTWLNATRVNFTRTPSTADRGDPNGLARTELALDCAGDRRILVHGANGRLRHWPLGHQHKDDDPCDAVPPSSWKRPGNPIDPASGHTFIAGAAARARVVWRPRLLPRESRVVQSRPPKYLASGRSRVVITALKPISAGSRFSPAMAWAYHGGRQIYKIYMDYLVERVPSVMDRIISFGSARSSGHDPVEILNLAELGAPNSKWEKEPS
jgi:hypothetical protein